MHLSESAFLEEGRVVEIIRLDAELRGDVVADHIEPFGLFGSEFDPLTPALSLRERGVVLLDEPCVEVSVDALGGWTSSLSWWMAKRTSESRSARMQTVIRHLPGAG
jgi:hypothetical protein